MLANTALELVLSAETYSKINNVVMSVLFFPALIIIAIYEKRWEQAHRKEMENLALDDEDQVSRQFPFSSLLASKGVCRSRQSSAS